MEITEQEPRAMRSVPSALTALELEVIVSGAGIGGLALAYWVDRARPAPDRSAHPRRGGAWTAVWRTVLALVLLGGCFRVDSGSMRLGVMPMLSGLPADPARRDAILDSSTTVARPEQRSSTTVARPEQGESMTVNERKAETAASTAAAILGSMFSKTQNVRLGVATTFDEGARAPLPVPPPPPASTDQPDDPAKPPAPIDRTDTDLIPWIKLR